MEDDAELRRRTMRAVKSKNTRPEMTVRRLVHGMGFRFRLHRKDLPGKPDIVFPSRRSVIFVHGCFWHGHNCRRGARIPKTNMEYWVPKLERNRARDKAHREMLEAEGWRVLVVWECETKDTATLSARLQEFLS
jgi:DNA mismatch endonuclease (patch repair protein)